MKQILVATSLILVLSSQAKAMSDQEAICAAVRATGGTCFGIDTSDPHAPQDVADTIFDAGLTNIDSPKDLHTCSNIDLKPSITISCELQFGDAHYNYAGIKGERITITVKGNNFVPWVSLDDANGEFLDINRNYDRDQNISLEYTLPYTGNYALRIMEASFKDEENQVFSIALDSDTSSVASDLQEDPLIEHETYTLAELQTNQSTRPRLFYTDVTFKKIWEHNESCTPEMYSCPVSQPPSILISDPSLSETFSLAFPQNDPTLTDQINNLVPGQSYSFQLKVQNNSKTNVPHNTFELVDILFDDCCVEPPPFAPMTGDIEEPEPLTGLYVPPLHERLWIDFINMFSFFR